MSSPKHTYYSIDVEASGPVPGLYNMVSLGAVAVHERDGGRLEIGRSFYAELRPAFAGHDPGANAIHGLDLEKLRREGLEPAEALRQLNRFVSETCDSGTKATFVGHVAVFDWMYVCWYYAWCGLENPFGYKGIDTKSLAMGALGLSWDRTGKETILPQLGVAPQAESTLHRADADAQHQAELFVALMRRSRLAP
ncbi:MAG: 3'-5' exonuclease [Acidobacteriota bacterium]